MLVPLLPCAAYNQSLPLLAPAVERLPARDTGPAAAGVELLAGPQQDAVTGQMLTGVLEVEADQVTVLGSVRFVKSEVVAVLQKFTSLRYTM